MALALHRFVLAAILVAGIGSAPPPPDVSAGRAPALCGELPCSAFASLPAGDVPVADSAVDTVAVPPRPAAAVVIGFADVAPGAARQVLAIAPKTSPPRT